jgi:hypothetical protein
MDGVALAFDARAQESVNHPTARKKSLAASRRRASRWYNSSAPKGKKMQNALALKNKQNPSSIEF